MENRPITAVFSSPQIRAMETAIAVASPAGVPVIPVRDLMEINYGVWEGKTEEELLRDDRALYEAWWSLDLRMDVHMALERLPQELREVTILYFFQEVRQKEIARILGINLPLVKYRIKRAKELLTIYLGKENFE